MSAMPPPVPRPAATPAAPAAPAGSLLDAGFSVAKSSTQPRLICCTEGLPGSGKTHWAFTAPAPIAYIGLDQGEEGVIDKFLGTKQVHTITFPPFAFQKNQQAAMMEQASALWEQIRKAVTAVCHPNSGVRTLIIDSATEAWEICRIARFGKIEQVLPEHYGPVNREFEALLRLPFSTQNLNAIYLHRQEKEYADRAVEPTVPADVIPGVAAPPPPKKRGGAGGSWTGRYERKGFKGMPYLAQAMLVHTRLDNGNFGIRVTKSRLNPTLDQQTFENPVGGYQPLDFATLAYLSFNGQFPLELFQ